MPKTNRYAACIRDEDELPKFVERMTANHYACVISPLHDQDHWTETDVKRFLQNNEKRYGIKIDPTGETFGIPTGNYAIVGGKRVRETREVRIPQVGDPKIAHRHFMVKYDYSLPATTVISEFDEMGFKILYFEPVKSERAYLRYMVHKDNPEKARYKEEDVISLGGIDLACIREDLMQDKWAIRTQIFSAIRQHPRRSFKQHILAFEKDGKRDLIDECKAATNFYRSLMWVEQ